MLWYADSDSDGFGDSSSSVSACAQPSGYISDSSDCDPSNGAIYPGADEYCNGIDDNCDGDVDESLAVDALSWYADVDLDGYGTPMSVFACTQPSGYVSDNIDCDDSLTLVFPGADELCNGLDDNCDGAIDESTALDAQLWYADGDTDGYGDLNSSLYSCTQPNGHVADSTDCDDLNLNINPAALEVCDGVDNNCNGLTDAQDPNVNGLMLYYEDLDGDGYGDSSSSVLACGTPSSGYVMWVVT